MISFNLISEPWIPCLFLNERSTRLLSLREVFHQASTIQEVSDPSPLVTVAIHRLLLAILHRNLGPASPADWYALWSASELPIAVLDAYLDQWQDRFDLFHPEYPFYQAVSLSDEYAIPVAKLAHEMATGNNATLFDHTTEKAGSVLTPNRAAALLLSQQSFAVGGLVSLEKGQDPKRYKSARGAILTKGAVVLVKGVTLRHTLLLNLHHYSPADEQPFRVAGEDRPWWELGMEPEAVDSEPTGYLDMLTWQSRRIRLIPDRDPGQVCVKKVVLMKGRQTPEEWSPRGREPMLAFRRNPTAKPPQDAWFTLGFQPERAIWRDSSALFHSAGGVRERPLMMDWLSRLVQEGWIDRNDILPVDLCGLSTDRAKILFWRHERLLLPLRFLTDPEAFELIQQSLAAAERVALAIRRASNRLAELILYPEYDNTAKRKSDAKIVRNLADSWTPAMSYWSALEPLFSRHVTVIAELPQSVLASGDPPPPMQDWQDALKRVARSSFLDLVADVSSNPRLSRAAALAEARFHLELARALAVPSTTEQELQHA